MVVEVFIVAAFQQFRILIIEPSDTQIADDRLAAETGRDV